MNTLIQSKLPHTFSYQDYESLMERLVEEGKTTGPNQSADMVHYTKMNHKRMARVAKKVQLNPALQESLDKLERDLLWIVITEAWCGDAAQIVPVLQSIAEYSPRIELKLILRDEHLDLMDAYLTGGSRSIPKLICLDANSGEELGSWGPRPESAQQMVMDFKSQNLPHDQFMVQLQQWYNRDKADGIQREIREKVEIWSA
jgi:hypothetical protein